MKSFRELLEMQKQLDEAIGKPRKTGFIQKKTFENIFLDLNDEFRKWLRKLPKELNFKNQKKKNYNREKELQQLTDMLFFFLQFINATVLFDTDKFYFLENCFEKMEKDDYKLDIFGNILTFNDYLWEKDGVMSFYYYMGIVKTRGFTREEIIDCYVAKWQKNMDRINGEWSNI